MVDKICPQTVDWKMDATIPDGANLKGTGGTINLEDQISKRLYVSGSKEEGEEYSLKDLAGVTLFLIRALDKDNNGFNVYPYLSYKIDSGEKTDFGAGPLLLIGSVGKLICGHTKITFWYNPPEKPCLNTSAGAAAGGKAAAPSAPDNALLSICIGIDPTSSNNCSSKQAY